MQSASTESPDSLVKAKSKSMWTVLKAWLPALVYMAAIYYMSSINKLPDVPGPLISWDKAQHVFAYFGLGLLLYRATALCPLVRHINPTGEVFLVASFYGIFDEVHQMYVPGRSAELKDWIADVAGVLLAIAIVVLVAFFTKGGRTSGRPARGERL